jgi:hypothetical protein
MNGSRSCCGWGSRDGANQVDWELATGARSRAPSSPRGLSTGQPGSRPLMCSVGRIISVVSHDVTMTWPHARQAIRLIDLEWAGHRRRADPAPVVGKTACRSPRAARISRSGPRSQSVPVLARCGGRDHSASSSTTSARAAAEVDGGARSGSPRAFGLIKGGP